MLRLIRFPYSTNVERVALALAYKGLEVESIEVDPDDRSAVRAASGQDLVPVLLDGDAVVTDSTRILHHLEARFPDPPLFPADPARAAEVEVFLDWFNRAWKREPNLIADALDRGEDGPDLERWSARLQRRLGRVRGSPRPAATTCSARSAPPTARRGRSCATRSRSSRTTTRRSTACCTSG